MYHALLPINRAEQALGGLGSAPMVNKIMVCSQASTHSRLQHEASSHLLTNQAISHVKRSLLEHPPPPPLLESMHRHGELTANGAVVGIGSGEQDVKRFGLEWKSKTQHFVPL